MELSGSGLQLAGSTLAVAMLGYALDHYLQTKRPIATGLGAVIGFSLGLFRFIVIASRMSHEDRPKETATSRNPKPKEAEPHDRLP